MQTKELTLNWVPSSVNDSTTVKSNELTSNLISGSLKDCNGITLSASDYNEITLSVSDYTDHYLSSAKSNWCVNPSIKTTYSGGFIVARKDRVMPDIEKVIFNPPATVVIWDDGTKTVVKAKESGRKKSDKDAFSEEYGLAMAIAKRYFGSRSAFLKAVENAKRPGAE